MKKFVRNEIIYYTTNIITYTTVKNKYKIVTNFCFCNFL